jgi:hypothetical protein
MPTKSMEFTYPRIFRPFIVPEGVLPISQEPASGPYPEPDQSSQYHPTSFLYDPI